jgi:sugar phosphate isomerase/epimerase
MAKLPFALQLYSVRDALAADFEGTLARVKEIGYDHVELADLAGRSPESYLAALEAAGLQVVSCHVPYETCQESLDQAVAQCQVLGVSWAVIPWLDPEANRSVEDWSARAQEMAAFGQAFREAGLTLCYHNHHVELEAVGDTTPFDVLFSTASAADLKIELDVGWAHYGGADTLALMHAHAGRIPLLHVKDVKQRYEGEEPVTTELGNGATPFGPLLKAAGEVGVEWLIVEQDESARDALESARMNAAYMRVHVF